MPYKDKEKQRAVQREHYKRNKDKFLSRNQERRKERKKWFRELIKGLSCAICKEDNFTCLDFHHKNPLIKKENVMRMLKQYRSKKTVIEEANKCILVCSNCHRKIHAGEIDDTSLELLNLKIEDTKND